MAGELKSAYEIAMERLRRKDAEEGVERRPLTEAQKAAIAEIRNVYEAKLAEQEVMHRSALARTFDPAEREALEEAYRRERERLIAERDAKIEQIRNQ
ncbi:MAG TPA: hypothetical protein VNK92_00110 [Vicinamibacterales bacterium]|jgi:LPS O-antigen subunit length determinant protein (WzzB/FepE family)|nr:hypothetical protein [Vicinamibacterales bacterium]